MNPPELDPKKSHKAGELQGGFPGGLSAPARRAISQAGFTKLDQLSEISEEDFRKMHGIGPKAVNLLLQAMQEKGLSFAQKNPPSKE
jgi:hypothetical protein